MYISSRSNSLIIALFYSCIFFRLIFATTNYCAIQSCKKNQQTMCLYSSTRPSSKCTGYVKAPLTKNEKLALINKHNELRKKVAGGEEKRGRPGPQPAASNMKILVWDEELARVAQRWADQCIDGHDKCRNVERFKVGQNIASYWSTAKITKPVESLIEGWYDEVKSFNGKSVNKYQFVSSTGHYSQLIWAETKYLGCARILYKNRGMNAVRLICNYGPAGNFINQPVYKIGKAASGCSNGASKTITGLCN